MYTLGAGRIFIKSIINVCLLNLMAWKASWAHRTGENEEKKRRSKRRAPVFIFEVTGDITEVMTYEPIEASDQPVHPSTLVKVFKCNHLTA